MNNNQKILISIFLENFEQKRVWSQYGEDITEDFYKLMEDLGNT